ncbi:MAG: hypothetical protein EA400_11935 [Chromatiaceae bacterium]|nr:MAG: hypothetical protein EA400_11935 [Chromatiaceae bacterium]
MHDDLVRIFVSSPADVAHERGLVKDLIERLGQEYLPYFRLQAVLWEEEALTADRSFQAGLVRPQDCEIVLVILWTRLGSPLPQKPYRGMTGTEWEFVDAVEGAARRGFPEVLVYKKQAPRLVDITEAGTAAAALADRDRLEAFFKTHFFNEDDSFRRAFRVFDSSAAFRDLVEVQLRKLLNRRISAERRFAAGEHWQGSPFRPDRPFERGDERVFTGREQELRDLLSRLHRRTAVGQGFLLLSGPSGSGKTSLLRAGLLPRLLRPLQFDDVVSVRACLLDPVDPAGGQSPLQRLATQLCAPEVLGEPLARFGLGPEGLADLLSSAPALAARQLGSALAAQGQARSGVADAPGANAARLVLLVDPLHLVLELPDAALRDGFARALAALVASGSVWVLGVLRSDALPTLAACAPLARLVDPDGWIMLAPPPLARLRQLVEIPARVAGIDLETRDVGHEHGLVELLEADAMPLRLWAPPVQAVLDAAYRQACRRAGGEMRLRAADYQALGGLAGLVCDRAEGLWAGLDAAARAALPRLGRALVNWDGGADGRAGLRQGDLAVLRRDPACARLLEALIEARLVVAEAVRDNGQRTPCPAPDYSLLGALRTLSRESREEWRARRQRRQASRRLASANEDGAAPAPASAPCVIPGVIPAATPPAASAATQTGADDPVATIDWGEWRAVASLVHPVLLSGFAPLRTWLAQPGERRWLALRGQLGRQALLWKRTDCNRDYLFREAGYAEVQPLAAAHADELEPLEQEFLDQCAAHLTFLRRRNLLVRGIGVVLVGLLLLATTSAGLAWRASLEARVNLHRSLLKEAEIYIAQGNTPRAVALAIAAGADLPAASVQTLSHAFSDNRLLAMLPTPPAAPGEPLVPGFSADGSRVATLVPGIGPRLWRLEQGRFVPEQDLADGGRALHTLIIPADDQVYGLTSDGIWQLPIAPDAEPLSPCGSRSGPVLTLDRERRLLALAGQPTTAADGEADARICVLDLTRPDRVLFDGTVATGEIRGLDFSPTADALLVAGAAGRAVLIDLESGAAPLALPAAGPVGRPFNQARFDAAGERIAVAAVDDRIRLYRRDGSPSAELTEAHIGGRRLRVHHSAVRDVAFDPSGAFLVAVDDDGQVVRWSLDGSEQAVVLGRHRLSVTGLAIMPAAGDEAAETLVLTASLDRSARLWGLETGQRIAVLGHDAALTAARFRADGQRVLTYSERDGSLRIWAVEVASGLSYRLRHSSHVWHLDLAAAPPALATDGPGLLLATAAFDGSVRVWRYRRGAAGAAPQLLYTFTNHRGPVRRVQFAPDGRRLVSAGQDGSAWVHDLIGGTNCRIQVSSDPAVRVEQARFDAAGDWVLSAASDPAEPVRAFTAADCQPLATGTALTHGGAPVAALALRTLEDGEATLVATGDANGTVRLLTVQGVHWQARCTLDTDLGAIRDLDLSPDGRTLAVAGSDGQAMLIELGAERARCRPGARLHGHSALIYSIAFAPDGRALLTASMDKTARLWERDGRPRAVLSGHQDRVYSAAFSPDGRWLLTASRDGRLLIWQRPPARSERRSTSAANEGAVDWLTPFLPLAGAAGGAAYAGFSPDGHYVAGAYWENTALLWRLWSEGPRPPPQRRRIWGAARAALALIDEAYRFKADNALTIPGVDDQGLAVPALADAAPGP